MNSSVEARIVRGYFHGSRAYLYYIQVMEDGKWVDVNKRSGVGENKFCLLTFNTLHEAETFIRTQWDGETEQPYGLVQSYYKLSSNGY